MVPDWTNELGEDDYNVALSAYAGAASDLRAGSMNRPVLRDLCSSEPHMADEGASARSMMLSGDPAVFFRGS